MSDESLFTLSATVLGAPHASTLMAFWRDLLGWQVRIDVGDWAMLTSPGGGAGLSFQSEPDHVPPTWPTEPDRQQMQLHLDIAVEDLEAGVARAVMMGASVAEDQPQDDVRVLFDPAGHPFCLFVPSH